MKIAVFGYYNALNAGDDRIQYCITRLFQGNTIVFLPHYLPPAEEYLQSFDWILIGGGGLVFDRVGIWVNTKQWIKKCRANIGVFGLGVNRVSPDLLPELSHLIEKADFFYVRDEKSKSLLNNHPKVKVQPDLTWIFPFSVEKSTKVSNKIAINLLPCHWKEFDVERWVKELELSAFDINPFPLNFNRDRDYDLLKKYFGNSITQEFSLQPLIDSEILVACRYHAIVFAMQIGKPFIAINYDEKVQRLLSEANLSELCLETTEFDCLSEKIDFVLAEKAEIQDKINLFATEKKEKAMGFKDNLQNHLQNHNQNIYQAPFTLSKSFKKVIKTIIKRS